MRRVDELGSRYALSADDIGYFREKGHVALRALAHYETVDDIRPAIDEATEARRWDRRSLEDRDTYGRAFVQAANVHQYSPIIERFTFARRFARVAAELLGVSGVRLYHDQALYKEPGGGFTPWHQDQVYWPLDTDDTITMWMPLVDVPQDIGGMVFADSSWRHRNLGEHVIGDSSHEHFEGVVREKEFSLSTHGPFTRGDATFHRGWTLHSAPANPTSTMRSVLTVIYYADGARVSPADHPARQLDLALWLGSAAPGSIADSNPLLWHESWETPRS